MVNCDARFSVQDTVLGNSEPGPQAAKYYSNRCGGELGAGPSAISFPVLAGEAGVRPG